MNAQELMDWAPPDPALEAWFLIQEACGLVEDGRCSPTCLFALSDDEDCRCRCDENHHGQLRKFLAATSADMEPHEWARLMRRLIGAA